MNNYLTTGNDVVDEVGRMSFIGNIVPNNWFKTILRENGKPDLVSIVLLADIVYWYRPTEVRDEGSGLTCELRKKFRSDCLQRNYVQITDMLGLSKEQSKAALQRLEKLGVVKREFRSLTSGATQCNNVMYLHLNPKSLFDLTYSETDMRKLPRRGEDISLKVRVNEHDTYEEESPDKYKDDIRIDYSETNPENASKLGLGYAGEANEDETFSDIFLEAWEEVPRSKCSDTIKVDAWKLWSNYVEKNGIEEEFLAKSYRRYIFIQRNAGTPDHYLAGLQTWLDPSKVIKGFSLKDAIIERARKEVESERARQRVLQERAEEERQQREQEAEIAWRESDPTAAELHQKAFNFNCRDFGAIKGNMSAYLDYRKKHFSFV